MVRDEQQLGGIGERRVAGPPAGVGVAMRADDGQRRDLRVQAPRDRALRCVGGKQAVFVEGERLGGDVHGLGSGCVVLPPSGAVNGMVSLQIALPVISTAGRNPQREINRISYRRWLSSGPSVPRARG